MFPVSESKMKDAAAGVPPPGGVILKSLVELRTTPVGNPPGILTVWGLVLRTTGAPLTSPLTNWVVLVALFEIQKGLLLLAAIPHGLTSNGSSTGARPGMSESNVFTIYADPGAIVGTALGPFGLWAVSFGAANPITNMITARTPNTKLPIRFPHLIELI
jgi:hypothetical protein